MSSVVQINITVQSTLPFHYLSVDQHRKTYAVFDLITKLCAYIFSKLLEKLALKYPSNKVHFKERSAEDFMRSAFNDAYAMSFSDFLYQSICCGYSFELPQFVEAIQMSSYNIYFYKAVDKSTLVVLLNCLTVEHVW